MRIFTGVTVSTTRVEENSKFKGVVAETADGFTSQVCQNSIENLRELKVMDLRVAISEL